jgi:hypothetical protein
MHALLGLNRRFSYEELVRFLVEQLPGLYPGCLGQIDRLYPVKQREVKVYFVQ